MFWKNYYNLCLQKGISPNAAAKEMKISSGAVTEWKKGRVPQMPTLKKIADYFGVEVSALTSDTLEPLHDAKPATDDITSGLTPNEIEELKKYAAFLISQRDKK